MPEKSVQTTKTKNWSHLHKKALNQIKLRLYGHSAYKMIHTILFGFDVEHPPCDMLKTNYI